MSSEVFNSQFVPPTLSPRNRHLGGRCNFGNIFVKCSRAAQRLSLSAVTGDTGCCGWSLVAIRRFLM